MGAWFSCSISTWPGTKKEELRALQSPLIMAWIPLWKLHPHDLILPYSSILWCSIVVFINNPSLTHNIRWKWIIFLLFLVHLLANHNLSLHFFQRENILFLLWFPIVRELWREHDTVDLSHFEIDRLQRSLSPETCAHIINDEDWQGHGGRQSQKKTHLRKRESTKRLSII